MRGREKERGRKRKRNVKGERDQDPASISLLLTSITNCASFYIRSVEDTPSNPPLSSVPTFPADLRGPNASVFNVVAQEITVSVLTTSLGYVIMRTRASVSYNAYALCLIPLIFDSSTHISYYILSNADIW